MPRTAHESITRNRQLKAERIASALIKNGVSLKMVRTFADIQWGIVAESMGYDHISPECRGICVDLFEHPEKLARRVA